MRIILQGNQCRECSSRCLCVLAARLTTRRVLTTIIQLHSIRFDSTPQGLGTAMGPSYAHITYKSPQVGQVTGQQSADIP